MPIVVLVCKIIRSKILEGVMFVGMEYSVGCSDKIIDHAILL